MSTYECLPGASGSPVFLRNSLVSIATNATSENMRMMDRARTKAMNRIEMTSFIGVTPKRFCEFMAEANREIGFQPEELG